MDELEAADQLAQYIVQVDVIDPDGHIIFTMKVNAPHDELFGPNAATPGLAKVLSALGKVNI